jgi:hypothetical protein
MRDDVGGNGATFDRNLTDFRVSIFDFSLGMCWSEKIKFFVVESPVCGAQTMLTVLSAKIALASKLSHKAKESKEFLKTVF